MLKASSIEDCLIAFQESQKVLGELTELKIENARELSKVKRRFEIRMSECREHVMKVLLNKGIKFTESIINSKAIFAMKEEWDELQQNIDDHTLYNDIIEKLLQTYGARKSIIQEMINHWKSKQEMESCIFNNKKFAEKLVQFCGKNF